MDLIKKLEKRARELDRLVVSSTWYGQQAADDRELLLEVIAELSRLYPLAEASLSLI